MPVLSNSKAIRAASSSSQWRKWIETGCCHRDNRQQSTQFSQHATICNIRFCNMQCQSNPNGDILRVIDQMSDALHLPAVFASEDMQDNIRATIRSTVNPQMEPRLSIYPYKDQDPDSDEGPVIASSSLFLFSDRVWLRTVLTTVVLLHHIRERSTKRPYNQMQHRVRSPVASEYAARSLRTGVYLGGLHSLQSAPS